MSPHGTASHEALPGTGAAAPGDLAGSLADRDQRLMAALTDGVLLLVSAALLFGLVVDVADLEVGQIDSPLLLQGLVTLCGLPISVLQWYLVATSGQSVGKKLQRIRIERLDGSAVGFWRGVVLRSWVLGALSAAVFCVRLVDYALIFREDRRCLHDLLAGTRVIKLAAVEPPRL